MALGELQRQRCDELEGDDTVAGPSAQQRQEIDGSLGARHRDEGRLVALRRGNSFSTAAVMMPSVPSAPMNRSRRS